jgi:hypothetical protein
LNHSQADSGIPLASTRSELALEVGERGFAQANNLKGCRSWCDHTYRGRSSPRKIEIATPHEGATIIDAHDHRAARGGIGHMQPRTEWEGAAGGSKTMLIRGYGPSCICGECVTPPVL